VVEGYQNNKGKFLIRGVLDGGFLSAEVAKKYGWVTPFRSDMVERETDSGRKKWKEYVNTFLATVRGPGAEGRFGDEVNKFGITRRPWRLEPELHTLIVQLVEVLLNVERREERNEPLDYTRAEAENSCFLQYLPTIMDDCLKIEGEEINPSIFEFPGGDEDIPSSMLGLFDDSEEYFASMITPINRTVSKKILNKKKQAKEKGKEKVPNGIARPAKRRKTQS